MDTLISSLMTTPVITVRADDTVTTVADVLARHSLSFVPVTERAGGAALGIISTGDILHFKNSGDDTDELKAWQICTYKPLSVPPDASIAHVARLMVEHQAHHVLVMRGQELAGIVSSLDFVKHYITHPETGAGPAQTGEGEHRA
jgi:CBS domain-containing protein